MNFRDLKPNETRILIVRHGSHKANVLTDEAIAMCEATGKALAEAGCTIDAVYSSPAPRALTTGLHIMEGLGKMTRSVITDMRLADTSVEPGNVVAEATAEAEKLGLSGEEGLARVLFNPNGKFADMMTRRGEEGADCLREIGWQCQGKTAMVPTHGVARIENMLMFLRGEQLHQPDRLAATCQIIKIVLNAVNGEVIEEDWLEPVTITTQIPV